MASKKTIKVKNVKRGNTMDLVFAHALALLRRVADKGTGTWEIAEPKWKFEDNDIQRDRSDREVEETA